MISNGFCAIRKDHHHDRGSLFFPGILICFVVGKYLNWSHLAFLGACLPVPFIILMFLIPETPRWYIAKSNSTKALKSLQWLRGKKTDVSEEMAGIEKAHAESEKNAARGALKELLKPSYRKPLLISLGLMAFQQLSGINAVIFYTVSIFEVINSFRFSTLIRVSRRQKVNNFSCQIFRMPEVR